MTSGLVHLVGSMTAATAPPIRTVLTTCLLETNSVVALCGDLGSMSCPCYSQTQLCAIGRIRPDQPRQTWHFSGDSRVACHRVATSVVICLGDRVCVATPHEGRQIGRPWLAGVKRCSGTGCPPPCHGAVRRTSYALAVPNTKRPPTLGVGGQIK